MFRWLRQQTTPEFHVLVEAASEYVSFVVQESIDLLRRLESTIVSQCFEKQCSLPCQLIVIYLYITNLELLVSPPAANNTSPCAEVLSLTLLSKCTMIFESRARSKESPLDSRSLWTMSPYLRFIVHFNG
jgi:predicted  nucleic acid-binding Zn ribbon protein